MRVMAAGVLALAVPTPATSAQNNIPFNDVSPDWRKEVTAADHDRLMGWRKAWTSALATVRAAGEGGRLDAEPQLFDPDRALSPARPPAGDYRCRWFKLGGLGTAMRAFTAYREVACDAGKEGELRSFAITGGPQRPIGVMFHDTGRRAVFLGTLTLGDETAAFDYGRDKRRDVAGYVERIGERRWRLVLPRPHFESTLDVIEIVPG